MCSLEQTLQEERGLDLENIAYFRGYSHHFTLGVTKKTLIKEGIIEGESSSDDLSNINSDSLHEVSSLR